MSPSYTTGSAQEEGVEDHDDHAPHGFSSLPFGGHSQGAQDERPPMDMGMNAA